MTAPWLSRGKLFNSTTTALSLAVSCVAALGAARAQFTSGVSAVEVYASVSDEKGEPITGLTAADFQVLEDGQPQAVSAFIAGEFPLTVALALDRSFSVGGERLETVKRAGHAFLDALRREDTVLLVKIGSRMETASDRTALHAEIDRIDAFGTTALHDSIVGAIEAVDAERGRRALVLFSDGVDRYSRTTTSDVLTRARNANVIVYPIAIGRGRPELFAELASLTGGRSFHARDGKGLSEIVATIARDLRFQYLLGYTPTRPIVAGSREWRSITVKVNRPRARVRARDGYLIR